MSRASSVPGAAGSYIVTLTAAALISMDLTIQPGQDVHIIGASELVEAPSWGSGGFVVGQRGSLSLASLEVDGEITVRGGGTVAINGGSLSGTITAADNATVIAMDMDVQNYRWMMAGGAFRLCLADVQLGFPALMFLIYQADIAVTITNGVTLLGYDGLACGLAVGQLPGTIDIRVDRPPFPGQPYTGSATATRAESADVVWSPADYFSTAPIEEWSSGTLSNDRGRLFTLYRMAPTIVPYDERYHYIAPDGELNYDGRGEGPYSSTGVRVARPTHQQVQNREWMTSLCGMFDLSAELHTTNWSPTARLPSYAMPSVPPYWWYTQTNQYDIVVMMQGDDCGRAGCPGLQCWMRGTGPDDPSTNEDESIGVTRNFPPQTRVLSPVRALDTHHLVKSAAGGHRTPIGMTVNEFVVPADVRWGLHYQWRTDTARCDLYTPACTSMDPAAPVDDSASEVNNAEVNRRCIETSHAHRIHISHPSPATDPSETHVIVELACRLAPTGQCVPSYLVPSIAR